MLFSFGHGQKIVVATESGVESNVIPYASRSMAAVAPGAMSNKRIKTAVESGVGGASEQSFGYMFPNAPGVSGGDPATIDALIALAAAMTEATGGSGGADSDIPTVMTYFGQFIDHDITANTDRDAKTINTTMTGKAIQPLDRTDVEASLMNLREGSLRLDSLYGDGPSSTAFTRKMQAAMRDPSDASKMRIGQLTTAGFGNPVTIPADRGADLPRLGDVLDDPSSGLTEADILGLGDELKRSFVEVDPTTKDIILDASGTPIIKRALAVIGDGRNDENLLVAQLHLAFLRFHNAVADDLAASEPDAATRFEKARQTVTHVYQWFVVNVYLPKVCMPSVVDSVKADKARLYHDFRARVASGVSDFPLPLEFSVAAFRFGHSMVRAEYDHNENFGRPDNMFLRRASFEQLFSFTGGGKLGELITGSAEERLAENWPIDWERFIRDAPLHSDRMARKIDTKLAPPLSDMFKEDDGLTPSEQTGELGRILRHLAERNLRRSHRLNIPSGQAVTAAVNAFDGSTSPFVESAAYRTAYAGDDIEIPEPPAADGIAVLPETVLAEGAAGAALRDGNMLGDTPLWFYLLREAEVTAGDTLGPLGSRLVAETLVGLVIEDSQSYWAQGSGGGSWSPSDAPIGGETIDSFPKMLASAGLL
jgi:hypothetical protein